jgi:hypothetical protein
MRVTIECKDRQEADAIRAAMADPTARATVLIIGILLGLSTPAERSRVLRWAADKFREDSDE